MTREVSITLNDDLTALIDETDTSLEYLLTWAAREHQQVHDRIEAGRDLLGSNDIIRDVNAALQRADREYRQATLDGLPAQDACHEAATTVVAEYEDSLHQMAYFSEAILHDGPRFSRDTISYHLVEDAGTYPPDIIRTLFQNVLAAYLEYEKLGMRAEEGNREPRPERGRPRHLSPQRRTDPSLLFEQCVRTTLEETPDETDPYERRDHAHTVFRQMTEEYTWADYTPFVAYVDEHPDATFQIPSDQLREQRSVNEIFSTITHWTADAYFDTREPFTPADSTDD